jgi:uncharacterized protein involved in tolerance to divalent cations
VVQEVVLPDGGEVAITVGYTTAPDQDEAWKISKVSGEQLDTLLERKVRACLSRFSAISSGGPQTWEAALESYDDIALEVRKSLNVQEYGLRLLDLHVVNIRKAGIMGAEDLRPGKAMRPNFQDDLRRMESRTTTMKQLNETRDRLLAEHPELADDIEDFYHRIQIRIREP